MRKAFTLSEVLITLGIIGIVAAMTIPTLIANTNGAKYRSQFKKALSSLNQAVKLNEANYEYNFASVSSNCINEHTDNPESVASICALFNGSMSGLFISDYTKLKTSKNTLYYQDLYTKGQTPDTLIKNQGVNLFYFQMKDGTFFAIHSPFGSQAYTSPCTLNNNTRTLEQAMQDTNFQRYCVGWIDVNGVSLPNKEVRCSDGKSHSKDIAAECVIPNKPSNMTDVFPVAIYDGTVAPGSAAARYVLNTAK
ncbi:MAG: type II secretion system GspH family protein [Muribaculaceae bacterium]|nr:type II secretion system GspH family protein [Muribaculaceae bacterium]